MHIPFKNINPQQTHKPGHCKVCHKNVKNIEAHNKAKHKIIRNT